MLGVCRVTGEKRGNKGTEMDWVGASPVIDWPCALGDPDPLGVGEPRHEPTSRQPGHHSLPARREKGSVTGNDRVHRRHVGGNSLMAIVGQPRCCRLESRACPAGTSLGPTRLRPRATSPETPKRKVRPDWAFRYRRFHRQGGHSKFFRAQVIEYCV